jgi:hypothetical protein
VVELCCGKVNEAYFRDQEWKLQTPP